MSKNICFTNVNNEHDPHLALAQRELGPGGHDGWLRRRHDADQRVAGPDGGGRLRGAHLALHTHGVRSLLARAMTTA